MNEEKKFEAKTKVTRDHHLQINPNPRIGFRNFQDLFVRENIGFQTYNQENNELWVVMKGLHLNTKPLEADNLKRQRIDVKSVQRMTSQECQNEHYLYCKLN